MKEYIFLFRGGKTDSASDQELDEHERAWDDWMDSLEEEGVLIDGLPMKDHAVIVDKNGASARQGSADDSVTGYLILETTDMEMAVELAQDCPIFDF